MRVEVSFDYYTLYVMFSLLDFNVYTIQILNESQPSSDYVQIRANLFKKNCQFLESLLLSDSKSKLLGLSKTVHAVTSLILRTRPP